MLENRVPGGGHLPLSQCVHGGRGSPPPPSGAHFTTADYLLLYAVFVVGVMCFLFTGGMLMLPPRET